MNALLLAVSLLCLPGSSPAQDGGYTLDAKLEEARGENGAPVLRLTGATNLPAQASITLHLYYGKVFPGKHLAYQAAQVEDGKFSSDFQIFRGRNLPGEHLVHVRFIPTMQLRSVLEKLGDKIRIYEKTVSLTIGTEKEIQEGRRLVHAQLGEQISRFAKVAEDVEKTFEAHLRKRDSKAWAEKEKEWKEEIHDAQNKAYNVPEFRALGISGIAEAGLEGIQRSLFSLVSTCAGALYGDNPELRAPQILERIPRHRYGICRECQGFLTLLQVNTGSREDLTYQLEKLVEHLASAHGIIKRLPPKEVVREGSGGVQLNSGGFIKQFQALVLQLTKDSPRELREPILSLTTAGREVCDAMEKAVKDRDNNTKTVDQALQKVKAAADQYRKALDQHFK